MNQEDIQTLQKLNVLYVEDDDVIQETFGKILQKVFAQVIMASNGDEGLTLYQENSNIIDFIISDIQMPKMDGLEMIHEIKKQNEKIPCILTTAHGEYDYFMRANEIGVYRYIQKPLNINELFEAIKDFQNGLEVKKIDL